MQSTALAHLKEVIIPYWNKLKDDENGGFYGYVGYDLKVDKEYEKGCILNSRILWFYANAYKQLKEEALLENAKHAYSFLKSSCLDKDNGGVYWSITYDGKPCDTTKHTYNQAFSVYALSSYYEVTKDIEALFIAKSLVDVIEGKMKDDIGYLEAFSVDFVPASNEKLSENGVEAEKTMNTLLHVLEAYTEMYRVCCLYESEIEAKAFPLKEVIKTLTEALYKVFDTVALKIYNPLLKRQEVFFDKFFNPIIDLHSYGHDIETAWLLGRSLDIVSYFDLEKSMYERIAINGEKSVEDRRNLIDNLYEICNHLTEKIYDLAYVNHSLLNECDKGVVNTDRIWWVQSEAVLGFVNGFARIGEMKYLLAAQDILNFILNTLTDKREGSEWFWKLDENLLPVEGKPITEPWKCPYHNGRMCFELMKIQ
ncbi:MAG: AGE family epimerase/isomerase [Lachnospiraceae bacterium]|nr:AGE family epimerase/isomerase [Lachnospiraceae bacterium]